MSFKNELKKRVERVYALTIQALAMLSPSVEKFPSQHFYYRV